MVAIHHRSLAGVTATVHSLSDRRTESTRGRGVAATRRDRGAMATRFAQITPEQLQRIQSDLERGELRDWDDLCTRMLQRDADIFATYESRLSVISGAEIVVEPGLPTGDPARDQHAESCALWADAWLRVMPTSRYAHESLDGIGRGLGPHEIQWSPTSLGLVPTALVWLSMRRFRYGDAWEPRICDMGGDVPVSSVGYELEPDRFVMHEPRALPGYPAGGVLRTVMWLFLIKSWAMQFWTGGAESFAWPLRVATVPRSSDDSARSAAKQFLEDLSTDHAAVLDEDMRFELLETTVKDGNVWANLVAECNRGIAKALLGMTDLAEPTRVGAYAAVETRKGATVDARVLKDERALAYTWERDLIEPAVRLNADRWGGVIPPIPRLRWSIAAKRQELDAVGVLAMTVDEVRAAQGKEPRGGRDGAQSWRDYIAGKSTVPSSPGGEPLNGAQIDALVGVLERVYAGTLPAQAARAVIGGAYPDLSMHAIEQMLAAAPAVTPVTEASPDPDQAVAP